MKLLSYNYSWDDWIHFFPIFFIGFILALNLPELDRSFYFDEMWKIDLITGSDFMAQWFSHDTPVPIGFVYLHKIIFFFIPNYNFMFRVVVLLWYIAFLWNIKRIIVHTFQNTSGDEYFFGHISILLLGMIIPFLKISSNFNHYTFELYYISLIVRYYINQRDSNQLLLFLLLAPLFTMAGLFTFPVVFIHLLLQYIKEKNIIMICKVVFTGMMTLVLVTIIYFYFYKPIQRGGILSFWKEYIIQSDFSNIP